MANRVEGSTHSTSSSRRDTRPAGRSGEATSSSTRDRETRPPLKGRENEHCLRDGGLRRILQEQQTFRESQVEEDRFADIGHEKRLRGEIIMDGLGVCGQQLTME